MKRAPDSIVSGGNDTLEMSWSEIVAKQLDPVAINWNIVIKSVKNQSKTRRRFGHQSFRTRE